MAVVVMPMLDAQATGIAFTYNPRSSRKDRLIVHTPRGLGEALVSGEAAGDDYLFAEDATDVWRVVEH
ncbi:MAG: hypothetical protein H3C26_16435 [Rhodocyclaceae bacterium]|nr:hypothetical protein [Rhodocyclaceae bacterium]